MRKMSMNSIEKNAMGVNARLLDCIKNGVKVKMMGEMSHERTALNTLEGSYDGPRRTNALLKFYQLKHDKSSTARVERCSHVPECG